MTFGFVPADYTSGKAFNVAMLTAPVSYIFLHGSWVHLFLNTLMLIAFGTGVERQIGGKRMLVLFMLCSLFSVFVHFIFNMDSTEPVIGASGGISGLFAAIFLTIQKRGGGATGRYGILPFVAIFIVISVLFGMIEAPGGGVVAWAAHIGGFVGGLIFFKPVIKYIRSGPQW